MDDVFIYFVPLPNNVHEMVSPCLEGYTIYLNLNDDEYTQGKSLEHAMKHIDNCDFEGADVQQMEQEAHLRI